MSNDPRCCGSGTCIIDTGGRCWCGQQWDGEKMARAPLARAETVGGIDDARATQGSEVADDYSFPVDDGASMTRP